MGDLAANEFLRTLIHVKFDHAADCPVAAGAPVDTVTSRLLLFPTASLASTEANLGSTSHCVGRGVQLQSLIAGVRAVCGEGSTDQYLVVFAGSWT